MEYLVAVSGTTESASPLPNCPMQEITNYNPCISKWNNHTHCLLNYFVCVLLASFGTQEFHSKGFYKNQFIFHWKKLKILAFQMGAKNHVLDRNSTYLKTHILMPAAMSSR